MRNSNVIVGNTLVWMVVRKKFSFRFPYVREFDFVTSSVSIKQSKYVKETCYLKEYRY
jgi:hypothetical protein